MKQARTERGARLHGVYRAVMEMVAFYLNEDTSFVEEGVLDSEHHLTILDNFFTPGGPQAVIFNCADRPIPPQGKPAAYFTFTMYTRGNAFDQEKSYSKNTELQRNSNPGTLDYASPYTTEECKQRSIL